MDLISLDIGRCISGERGPGLADLIKLRKVRHALFDCYLDHLL